MTTHTVHAIGHQTVFTYADPIDAGIHARILESVGYTVVVRSSLATVTASDRAVTLCEDDMSDHETYR